MVEMLLRCGANPRAADYDARTCLHLAASNGNLPICEELLSHGAGINSKDRWGGTPLRDAVREGYSNVAALLFSRGEEEPRGTRRRPGAIT